jgi:ubiquinone/menaquinone biosynthesis C-methylase UbiE
MVDKSTPEALRTEQYRDSKHLEARIVLHRRFSVNQQGWTPWLFEQIELAPDAELLELGCGAGTLWSENAGRIPYGWRVRLSDFSAGMLSDAERNLSGVDHAFKYEIIDATEIPHPENEFDCVLANHMLYHIEDRPKALAEMRRVLRPGGLLVASTLTRDTMSELGAIVREATDRSDFTMMRMAAQFGLDDGAEQLEPYFAHIERRVYEDALEITECQPVLDYLSSLVLDEPFTDSELVAIGRCVDTEIGKHGRLHVGKSAGVFRAS